MGILSYISQSSRPYISPREAGLDSARPYSETGEVFGAGARSAFRIGLPGAVTVEAGVAALAQTEAERDPALIRRLKDRRDPATAPEQVLPSYTDPAEISRLLAERGMSFNAEKIKIPEGGLTLPRAMIYQMTLEDEERDRFIQENARPGLAGKLVGFGGGLAGSLADPINFIPFAGGLNRALAPGVKRLSREGLKAIGRGAAIGAGANVAAAAVSVAPAFPLANRWGADLGWEDAVAILAFAGVLGSAFGSLGAAFGKRRAAGEPAPIGGPRAAAELHRDGMTAALNDLEAGRSPNVGPVLEEAFRAAEAEGARLTPEDPFAGGHTPIEVTPETRAEMTGRMEAAGLARGHAEAASLIISRGVARILESTRIDPNEFLLNRIDFGRMAGEGAGYGQPMKPAGDATPAGIPQSSLEAARSRYEGTDAWMKAPNGQPTKLNERQWLTVQTPEFKAWFGASKVVDENGEPLVVYHNTSEKRAVFDRSYVRKSMEIQAHFFAPELDPHGEYGPVANAVFLRMENPADFKTAYEGFSAGRTDYEGIKQREKLQAQGYDGGIMVEDGKPYEYFVFDSERIKSVHNRGTFDKNDPRILYQPAYHGGPHRFDKFTLDHIGSGEGNQSALVGGDKQASALLNEAGIPGLRYLDGNSRRKGEGSHNYVIFDDKAIKILETYYQSQARGRLERINGQTQKFLMSFGESADASTPIHEGAHLFRELMAEVLALPAEHVADRAAFGRLKEEWGRTEAWLGRLDDEAALKADYDKYLKDQRFGGRELGELTPEEKVTAREIAKHELFSRAFETYLLEGRAPTEGLRALFEKMKGWLLEVYRSIKDLDAPLSDETRAFFDRLAAEDWELALDPFRETPLDKAAREAGGLESLRAGFRREAEAMAEEDYGLSLLRELRAQGGVSLDSVRALGYDREKIREIQKRHPGLISKKSRIGLDDHADRLGFEGADGLLDALMAAPTRKQFIDDYVAGLERDLNRRPASFERGGPDATERDAARMAEDAAQVMKRKETPESRRAELEADIKIREAEVEQKLQRGEMDEATALELEETAAGLEEALQDRVALAEAAECVLEHLGEFV